MIIRALFSVFDLLFQKNCLVCESFSHSQICHRCQLPEGNLRLVDKEGFSEKIQLLNAVSNYYSVWEYQGNPRDLCLAMKYKPSLRIIKFLSELLAKIYIAEFGRNEWDYIVPIPSSAEGMKQRGFNHILVLGKQFVRSARLQKTSLSDCLSSNMKRRPQASLSGTGRVKGIKRRFKVKRPERFEGKNILIIDDILTTGSTVTSAALALRKAGASRVDAITLCYRPLNYL